MALRDLIASELSEMTPYTPVQGEYRVRLDANEAPALLSAGAKARLAEVAAQTDFRRYPDATLKQLRHAIGSAFSVAPEELVVGTGSDELITLILAAFSRRRSPSEPPFLVTSIPSFVMYKMSARVRGFRVVEVPLTPDWSHDVPGLIRAAEMCAPHLLFVASPNNPTGTTLSTAEVRQLASSLPDTLLVLDEAYVDYADHHQLTAFREHENVLILRTLSKVGFAALRVGWASGHPDLIQELEKVRQPYNVSALSQRLATVVFSELQPEIRAIVAHVKKERERVTAELADLDGVTVTPSQANFLWMRTEPPAEAVFESLAKAGVLVRSFHNSGGRMKNQLRVTLGTEEENRLFTTRLREAL